VRNRTDVAIGVLLVTLLSWAVWEAQGWPARTRFFPLAIGYPVLALSVMHLAYSLWLGLRPAQGPAEPEPAADGGIVLEPAVVRRRTLEISFWAVTFAVGLYLLGFKVGGLIIPTIFLRYQARELWRTSLLYSLGVYVFFKIGLEEALSFPLPAGQIAFGLGFYSFDSYLIDPVLNLFR